MNLAPITISQLQIQTTANNELSVVHLAALSVQSRVRLEIRAVSAAKHTATIRGSGMFDWISTAVGDFLQQLLCSCLHTERLVGALQLK